MTFLLDSVILIDHFNGIPQATEFLVHQKGRCVISAITRSEVIAGSASEMTDLALDEFETLVIDVAAANLAGKLRKEFRWKLPDAYQAALAQRHGLKLATRNTRDFDPTKFKFVFVPYHV